MRREMRHILTTCMYCTMLYVFKKQLSSDQWYYQPIPVAARSKAWVSVRSLAGIVGLNPGGCMGCLSVVSVVCCQVDVSESGSSLGQRSPTECGVSDYDR